MSANLFKRAAVFTDIHFGKKNNDRQFNTDCERYVKWFIKQAKKHECDIILFLGDYFDNRNSIHISTLNYALSSLELLNKSGLEIIMIPGNHDEYYRHKREITSLSVGRNLNNITILNDITTIGNVTFCPWLVGDEWKQIPEVAKKSAYIFGHFELPTFMMNAMVEMPDHGGLNATHFDDVEFMAFSGHFHKRQIKGKVCYVGSPFPHDFADAWDDERGMMILEWGKRPKFINWEEGPRYRSLSLSDILEDPMDHLNDRTYAKVSTDIDINYEEAQFIKEVFAYHFGARKFDVVPSSKTPTDADFKDDNVEFKSVDQIVVEGLKSIDSPTMDSTMLIQIYQGL